MLLVAAAVLGFLAGLATGGSIRPVLRLRLRWPLVAVAAVAVRVLGVFEPLATSPLIPPLFVASLLLLIAWTLWNRDVLRGAWLIALGEAMNLAVVLANGGRMPVVPPRPGSAPSALTKRGVWGQYVLARPGMHAVWLGDRLQVPAPLGRVFREIYSPGDLVVCLGLGVVFYLATRPSSGIPSQR